MTRGSHRLFAHLLLSAGIAGFLPTAAFAQEDPDSDIPEAGNAEDGEAIVVTGTLLRGVAPVGSQAIQVTEEEIIATGASNTSNLLASIPQAGLFNIQPSVPGGTQININRPTLRNLGNTNSGTASTLLLVDGHRLPGMGIRQTSPDADAIAPGAIERVEVVPDGGSSTYGSDAVGGVINFITRKRFDGAQVKARYSFAGDYYQAFDGDVIVGKEWESASVYVAYNYEWRQAIRAGELDYIKSLDYINGGVGSSLACDPGNVVVGSTVFALPSLTPGLGNRCDPTKVGFQTPKGVRHSALASLNLDGGGPVTFDFKAYYFWREGTSPGGPRTGSISLRPTITSGPLAGTPNPFYIAALGGATQTFQLRFTPVLGDTNPSKTTIESYGFTPRMDIDLGADWQASFFANFGQGTSESRSGIINTVVLSNAANAGLFDPRNLTSPSTAAALQSAADFFDYGWSKNTLGNARLVLDGPLFPLPGGDVRVAVGTEYIYEQYEARIQQASAANIPNIPHGNVSHNIIAVFGEINLPLLGEDQGVHDLSVTASGRYDRYSDYGGAFNPRIAANFSPVDWFTLRGNWGKSFQAPSLANSAKLAPPTFVNLGSVRFPKPGVPFTAGQTMVFLGGTVDPLEPQTATTYTFGFDLKPPIIDRLNLGATYYRIKFKDQIAVLPIFDPLAYTQFPDLIIQAPTQAQVNALAALGSNPNVLTSVPLTQLYAIGDGRNRNLAQVDVQGVDFYGNYTVPTSFGSVYVNVAGNYILKFTTRATPFATVIDTTKTNPRLRITSTLGAEIGNLRGQATYSYVNGFNVTPTPANLNQAKIDGFGVVNLFFQYDVPGSGLMQDLSFTLNIDNAFDTDPPPFNGSIFTVGGGGNSGGGGAGYGNGFTLGRVVKFGVNKRF